MNNPENIMPPPVHLSVWHKQKKTPSLCHFRCSPRPPTLSYLNQHWYMGWYLDIVPVFGFQQNGQTPKRSKINFFPCSKPMAYTAAMMSQHCSVESLRFQFSSRQSSDTQIQTPAAAVADAKLHQASVPAQ